jgi:hypothetical protein
MSTGSELACDLTALSPQGRERVLALSVRLMSRADDLRTLPDGFEIGFGASSPELLSQLAEFIVLDGLCCPFLRHGIFLEPHEDGVWLHLSGPEEVKDSLGADILRAGLPRDVAINAGMDLELDHVSS